MDERNRRADEMHKKLTSSESQEQDERDAHDELSPRRSRVGQPVALTRRERAERWPIG